MTARVSVLPGMVYHVSNPGSKILDPKIERWDGFRSWSVTWQCVCVYVCMCVLFL